MQWPQQVRSQVQLGNEENGALAVVPGLFPIRFWRY